MEGREGELAVMKHVDVRLPSGDGFVAPVTILDREGHVVRVVSAEEFRRDHPTIVAGSATGLRQSRRRQPN